MNYTRDEVIKRVTEEIDGCLEYINAEIYDYSDKIMEVDMDAQTITIRFDYNVVEEDNYIGICFY